MLTPDELVFTFGVLIRLCQFLVKIAQCSKGAHYFHRFVGLYVNDCTWRLHTV